MDARAEVAPTVTTELEIRLLLEAIYEHYHYDFRHYAMASLQRRVQHALTQMHQESVSALQATILHKATAFTELLRHLTIPVSDMFRDPDYFAVLRRDVIPVLATYPTLKVWIAGCSTGEEAYSLAILLAEENLLKRSIIYATDINGESLQKAQAGVFGRDRLQQFTQNHRASGATRSLSADHHAAYDSAVMDAELRRAITFSDHSLATDNVFSEVQLVSCRNVLIYFNRELQDRAIQLFADALCPRGFLGLGSKETLRFSKGATQFTEFRRDVKLYRKQT